MDINCILLNKENDCCFNANYICPLSEIYRHVNKMY